MSNADAHPAGPIHPPRGTLREYLAIARFDHSTKHVFIIPGIVTAYALREPALHNALLAIVVGFASAVAIASANYVINEWLDREFDMHHPNKVGRTAVQWTLSPSLIYAEYAILAATGLLLAWQVGAPFFWTAVVFLMSGLIYNVEPIRTKDRPFVDVISESINNPIRLTLGWTMIEQGTLPPLSLLAAYWAGGAFLMAAKRLSEYRELSVDATRDALHRYRRSFRLYTAESLSVSCFLYAMISAFALAVFLTRYRLEYVLALPFVAALFSVYFWLAMLKGSVVQHPERTFRSRRVLCSLGLLVLALLIVSFVDMPFLYDLLEPGFVPVDLQR